MRVAIVNDCAFVGLTLKKELERRGVEVVYLPRGVSILDKIAKAFINAIKAGAMRDTIVHVNYALQDAYILARMGRLDVLHCHGSDVRWEINRKFGWMVKYSLRKAKKVLYSTPDLDWHIWPFRKDAEYLPNPIDLEMFKPSSGPSPPRALYRELWYEEMPKELPKMLEEVGIELDVIRGRPYRWEDMPKVFSRYGIFIDRFTIRSFSKTCLEAMACGLATIDFRHKDWLWDRVKFLSKEENRRRIGGWNRAWIESNHDVRRVVDTLLRIYDDAMS